MDVADLYSFQTATGMIVPTTEEVKAGWEEKFKSIFGSDLDVTETTVVGRLIEALTVLTKTTCAVNAQNANQFNIHFATGTYLDSLGKLFDVPRELGTKTKAPITVTSSVPVTIPAGSLVMSENTYDMFTVDYDINVGISLRAGGSVTAVNYGPVPADPHTITKIQTGTLGWLSVDNPTYFSIGKFEEDDDSYRERILTSKASGTGFMPQILSAINKIKGVSSVCVLENNEVIDKIINGVPVSGHSIFVCVDGLNGENERLVANAIERVKPAGTGMVHSKFVEKAQVKAIQSSSYTTYYVYEPQIDQITVEVQVDASGYLGGDADEDIKSAVEMSMKDKGIGDYVYSTSIAHEISVRCPGVMCKSVYITSSISSQVGVQELKVYAYQKANVIRENIIVKNSIS